MIEEGLKVETEAIEGEAAEILEELWGVEVDVEGKG